MTESCLIIAGEKSGEEHALTFLPQLGKTGRFSFWGVGGDELVAGGVEVIYHLREFSSMGFSEVIGKIPFYWKAMRRILAEVDRRNTKHAILVDFQTFNLKLAEKLKKKGVKVQYYVAPQAWAWKAWRSEVISRSVDTLYCILPFEKEWFCDRGVKQVVSVDHPLWRASRKDLNEADFRRRREHTPQTLLILPGSRRFEVEKMLPEMIPAAKELKQKYGLRVSLVRAGHLDERLYREAEGVVDTWYTNEQLNQALKEADLSMATSGTVTLACGLFGVPTVVCYKSSLLNEWVFYSFINYEGAISLTNLILGKMIFPELKSDSVSSFNIVTELERWLSDKDKRSECLDALDRLRALLGGDRDSSELLLAHMGDNA